MLTRSMNGGDLLAAGTGAGTCRLNLPPLAFPVSDKLPGDHHLPGVPDQRRSANTFQVQTYSLL